MVVSEIAAPQLLTMMQSASRSPAARMPVVRWLARLRRRSAEPPSHNDAVRLLHELEHQKQTLDAYEQRKNIDPPGPGVWTMMGPGTG